MEAVYGSRDRIDLRASMNFALTDSLSARISGVYKHQKGYVDQIDYGCAKPGNAQGIGANPGAGRDCVIDKLGEKGYAGIRGSLRYNPSDAIDWVVSADYTREDRTNAAEILTTAGTVGFPFGGLAGLPTSQYLCGKFCTYTSFYAPAGGQVTKGYTMPNSTKFEGWGVSSNLSADLSDTINLQSITAYRDYRQIWGTDDDFTPDPAIIGQGYNDLSFRFFSQELRVNAKLGDMVDLTVGAFYSDQKSVYYTRQDIRYAGVLQFEGNDPVNADSKAVFGTVIARPMEALTLTGGLRYTKESKDYTFFRKNFDGITKNGPLGALDGVKAVYSGNKVDWRVSADYRFSPAVLAYVTVGTGFKGGGVTARPFDAAQALNGSFDPETVLAYEVGLKTDLLDRRLRVNVAAFINDYKNIQLPLSTCASLGSNAPCGARQNAGDGKIKGFEVELNANPVAGLDIDASLSHLTGHWSTIDPRVGNAYLLSDPIVTPNWKWSAGIQYKADLGGAGSLTPRFDMAYTGKSSAGRTAGGAPIDYYPSRTLANARLTWRNADDDLSVSLEVQNLFDKYYLPFRFSAVQLFTGTIYSQVGRPREWAVSVKKSF